MTPDMTYTRQSGAALVIALVFLLMLTLLGLTSSQVSLQQERMSGNYLEWSRAHQAAEQALRDLERQMAALVDSRPTTWNVNIREWRDFAGLVDVFAADCTLETLYGDDWPAVNMDAFPGGAFGDLPPPQYLVVELAEFMPAGAIVPSRPPCYPTTAFRERPEAHSVYLITVRGFGPGSADRRAEAMVQSIFYREHL